MEKHLSDIDKLIIRHAKYYDDSGSFTHKLIYLPLTIYRNLLKSIDRLYTSKASVSVITFFYRQLAKLLQIPFFAAIAAVLIYAVKLFRNLYFESVIVFAISVPSLFLLITLF